MARGKPASINWYGDDALVGMSALSLEEKGLYITIISMIVSDGGPVPEDEDRIARFAGCSKRKYRSVRDALIEKGKIDVRDGFVRQNRAESELNSRRKLAESGANGGRKSAEQREKDSENNEDPPSEGDADASKKSQAPYHTSPEEEDSPLPPKGGRKRRSALPTDRPSKEDVAWADQYWRQRGHRANMRDVIEGFRNHHLGRGTLSADWSASWRTWAMNEVKFAKPRAGAGQAGLDFSGE